ncbi:porin [Corticibacter populi]|uniref:Porin n=1 Tax=Corticibacter populi TaxID=1550736 RepID=A0A3M6QS81_9BURK|nr:porin [Corticibacter populi]RMX05886.1 porin [Corticibacter populi]RZS30795.1 putative porin [Corticibacter populi]
MKKSISQTAALSFVAALALVPLASVAQSSVTLYGRVDLGLRYDSSEDASGQKYGTRMATGTNSALGFKGSEDLGGNTKVFFQLEHRLNAADGSAANPDSFFTEIAVLGISGDWGTLRMGRSDGPFWYGPGADAFYGDYVGGRGERRAGADDKFNSGVMYWTPELAGFQVLVGTTLTDRASINGVKPKHPLAATLLYKAGAFSGSLGYVKRFNEDAAIGGSASYDFGVLQAFLSAAHNDGEGLAGISTGERTTATIGAGIPVSAVASVRVKYNYDDNQDIKTQHAGLGYWYSLSKRTKLYTTASYQKTEHLKSTRALDIGLLHDF